MPKTRDSVEIDVNRTIPGEVEVLFTGDRPRSVLEYMPLTKDMVRVAAVIAANLAIQYVFVHTPKGTQIYALQTITPTGEGQYNVIYENISKKELERRDEELEAKLTAGRPVSEPSKFDHEKFEDGLEYTEPELEPEPVPEIPIQLDADKTLTIHVRNDDEAIYLKTMLYEITKNDGVYINQILRDLGAPSNVDVYRLKKELLTSNVIYEEEDGSKKRLHRVAGSELPPVQIGAPVETIDDLLSTLHPGERDTYNRIKEHPGESLTELTKGLGLKYTCKGLVGNRVKRLEELTLVKTAKGKGNKTLCYTIDYTIPEESLEEKIETPQKPKVSAKEVDVDVLADIKEYPGTFGSAMARRLSYTQAQISLSGTRLHERGQIIKKRHRSIIKFYLKGTAPLEEKVGPATQYEVDPNKSYVLPSSEDLPNIKRVLGTREAIKDLLAFVADNDSFSQQTIDGLNYITNCDIDIDSGVYISRFGHGKEQVAVSVLRQKLKNTHCIDLFLFSERRKGFVGPDRAYLSRDEIKTLKNP